MQHQSYICVKHHIVNISSKWTLPVCNWCTMDEDTKHWHLVGRLFQRCIIIVYILQNNVRKVRCSNITSTLKSFSSLLVCPGKHSHPSYCTSLDPEAPKDFHVHVVGVAARSRDMEGDSFYSAAVGTRKKKEAETHISAVTRAVVTFRGIYWLYGGKTIQISACKRHVH